MKKKRTKRKEIREYFKNSKNTVEKFLIQREGKATVVVPGTERFNLNKDILDCEIKSVTISSVNEYEEETISIHI